MTSKLERKIARLQRQLAATAKKLERERVRERRELAKRAELEEQRLNPNEHALLRYVVRHAPLTVTIADIGNACYYRRGARSRMQAESWARNSSRKPLRLGLIERMRPGVFRATSSGVKAVRE